MNGSVVFSKDAPPPSLANATSSTATRPSSFARGRQRPRASGTRSAAESVAAGWRQGRRKIADFPPDARLKAGSNRRRCHQSSCRLPAGHSVPADRARLQARRRAAVDRGDRDATVTGNAGIEDAAVVRPAAFFPCSRTRSRRRCRRGSSRAPALPQSRSVADRIARLDRRAGRPTDRSRRRSASFTATSHACPSAQLVVPDASPLPQKR